MKSHSPAGPGMRVAIAAAALLFAVAAGPIEVDPYSLQGRTQAAIKEFRAAVELEPDLQHGARLFTACAECHQADGSGQPDGSVPVIAGQHVSVLVKQLVDFRHDRRWSAYMPDAAKMHGLDSSQDLLDVAAYAESLKRLPPRQGGPGGSAVRLKGQVVYYRDCAQCHGRLGEGELRTLRPRLAGQHYRYLLKQLNQTAVGGRPGMDAEHVKRIGALSDEERAAVADYLSGLSPELVSKGPW
jgi:cytochrome c553